MKKRVTMVLAMLLALALLLGGCAKTTAPAAEATAKPAAETAAPAAEETAEETAAVEQTLDPVTLKLIFFGDKKSETDHVFSVIADTYRDQMNCDYEVVFIPETEYAQKLLVKAAAGESWDLNFDGDWVCYYQMVAKDAYMDLTDLVPQYAPAVYAKYQANDVLSAATYNGKLVALPWTMKMNNRPWYTWRGDLAEKAGLNIVAENVKTFDDVYAVMEQLHAAYPDKQISRDLSYNYFMVLDNLCPIGHSLYVDLTDPNYTVVAVEQTESYKYFAEFSKKCQDAGFISADVLTDGLDGNALLNNGQLITRFGTHEFANSVRAMVEPDAVWTSNDLYTDHYYANRTPLANIVCIPETAENPERALMMLNMVETDQSYYDMLHYGIENETYVLNGESADYPADMNSANSNYMDWGGRWAFWKPQFMRPTFEYPAGFWEREEEYADKYDTNVSSALSGFSMNVDSISVEIAQRDQIYADANKLIGAGLAGDADAAIEKLIADQQAAGLDQIVAEVQKQLTAYMADK